MKELKQCPFCGSLMIRIYNLLENEPDYELMGLSEDNWEVLCQKCFATGGVRRTEDEAIEAWNMRAD